MERPTQKDVDAIINYALGTAQNYTGMSYADGLLAVAEWLNGDAPRPDLEEE